MAIVTKYGGRVMALTCKNCHALIGITSPSYCVNCYNRLIELEAEVKRLREALTDCMTYVDCDNLTQQTKHRNWQAVLDGKPWNRANVEVEQRDHAEGE